MLNMSAFGGDHSLQALGEGDAGLLGVSGVHGSPVLVGGRLEGIDIWMGSEGLVLVWLCGQKA